MRCAEVYSSVFKASGKEDYEICVFEDATHELLKREYKPLKKGGFSWQSFKALFNGKGIYADGFLDKLGDWVVGLE